MPSLQFKGKVFVENHHLAVPFHELRPIRSKGLSKKVSLHDNLIVKGDNLAALKALLPIYHSKIKCIYIDPPYNTGNEGWIYNDKVNSPMMQDWLGNVVDREDLTRHDKWCCMMLPRLKLLRELLRDDGVIFVSIDDNECHHLRLLMDDVFGEENFFATLTRRAMHTVRNSSKGFNLNADYVLVYAKSKEWFDSHSDRYIRHITDKSAKYTLDDNDGKGTYKLDPLHARNPYQTYIYKFLNGVVWSAPAGSYPRYSQCKLREMDESGRIVFGGKEPKAKRYLKDVQEGQPPDAVLVPELVGFNKDGTSELQEIFGKGGVFLQPKPTKLIIFLLKILRAPDAIVLDSFAGSGTTAHAVLALNKADGGSRRFVLIECEDYAESITAERVRRVIKGVKSAKDKDLKAGFGGTFSYFDLGKPMRQESLLDGSNLPDYETLASYIFFTATGEEFDPKKTKKKTWFIGRSERYDVFLIYEPDLEKLKNMALTLDMAKNLPRTKRSKLVFAPTKYLDPEFLQQYRIIFQQLPFQIYGVASRLGK